MTEGPPDPSIHDDPVLRGGQRAYPRKVLLLVLGMLLVCVDIRVGAAKIDVMSDYLGYAIFGAAAWALRPASRWFAFATLYAALAAILQLATSVIDTPIGIARAVAAGFCAVSAIGAVSFALSGAAELAVASNALTLASRARLVRTGLWIVAALECVALPFRSWPSSQSVSAILGLVALVAAYAAFVACAFVFTQLSGRLERENVVALRLQRRTLT